jgi:hypothetical protein
MDENIGSTMAGWGWVRRCYINRDGKLIYYWFNTNKKLYVYDIKNI